MGAVTCQSHLHNKPDIMCLNSFRGAGRQIHLDRARLAVSLCFQSLCQAKLTPADPSLSDINLLI